MLFDFKFFIYYGFAAAAVTGSVEGGGKVSENNFFHADSAQKTALIIDTDAGTDDAVAILNLLGAEELFGDVQVQFVTTVNGNTAVKNVAKNVLKILKTAERLDIPVYNGASESLFTTPKVDNYFGEDGFGDFHFPNPPSLDLIQNQHAVNALIENATSQPGELTLLCLGPLTNIALALRMDGEFFRKLKEIYILGGSDSGVGNVKPGVEFNFHIDPEAAAVVLKEAQKANKILNVLTWESILMRSPIEMEWRKHVLGAVKSPQIDLINKAESQALEKNDTLATNWVSADTVLSAVVIDRKIVESSEVHHGDVEVCGALARGSLFIDYGHHKNLTKNIRIIKKINTDMFKKMLLQNLDPWGGETNGASRV